MKNKKISEPRFDLYSQFIERLSLHIYLKDKSFQYINCNELQAKNAGFTSSQEIIGR